MQEKDWLFVQALDMQGLTAYDVEELIGNKIWRTADRRRIPVKNMSTDHINNCIKCWEGKGNMIIPENYLGGKEKWLKIFNAELILRQ